MAHAIDLLAFVAGALFEGLDYDVFGLEGGGGGGGGLLLVKLGLGEGRRGEKLLGRGFGLRGVLGWGGLFEEIAVLVEAGGLGDVYSWVEVVARGLVCHAFWGDMHYLDLWRCVRWS